MLLQAKDMDPGFVQMYVGLTHVYGLPKDRKKAHENIIIALKKY